MANNIQVKDAAAATQTVKTTDNAGVHTPHHNVDNVVAVSDNGGSLTVDGTVAVTDGGGSITVDGAVVVGDGGGSITVDGTLTVQDGGGSISIDDNGGSVTVDGAVTVTGNVANDAADSGNPVKIGGIARTANPTAVAGADRVDAAFDDLGRQLVVQGQVRDLISHANITIANSTTETTLLAAVASTFLDLVSLVLTNASSTAVTCTLKDSTGGTTRMIIDLAANGGAVINLPRPLPQATVNNNWTLTLSINTVTVHAFAMAEQNV